MPTWTLTPISGDQTTVEVADFKADPKGVVLGFATTTSNGTETYHLAPEHEPGKMSNILNGGFGILADVGGAGGGFKLAEEAMAKFDPSAQGTTMGRVADLAGAALGAFLAHAAKTTAETMYENHEVDHGDYYDSSDKKVFQGPVKVSPDGSQIS
jgi:hypothetical protein